MKRKKRVLILFLSLVLLSVAFFYFTGRANHFFETQAEEVYTTSGLVYSKSNQALFTGRVTYIGKDIENVLPYDLSKISFLQDKPIGSKGLQCLLVKVEYVKGVPVQAPSIYVDLKKIDVLPNTNKIKENKNFRKALVFSPVLHIGVLPFEGNQFNGKGCFYFPSLIKDNRKKAGELIVQNGKLYQLTLFYRNENVRLQNDFVKGVIKKYSFDGYLKEKIKVNGYDRHGEYNEYYKVGALKKRAQYVNGFIEGNCIYYYPDSSVQKIDSIKRGEVLKSESYYSSGLIQSRVDTTGEHLFLPEGVIQSFYKEGYLHQQISYSKGKKNGVSKTWYKNKQLWELANYKNDSLEGIYKKWFKNGVRAYEYSYVNYKKEGTYYHWYDNGVLRERSHYVNGFLHGKHEKWFTNETKAIQTSYVNGRLEGKYLKWYESGQLRLRTTFKNGYKHGSFENWLPDGSLYKKSIYINGRQQK